MATSAKDTYIKTRIIEDSTQRTLPDGSIRTKVIHRKINSEGWLVLEKVIRIEKPPPTTGGVNIFDEFKKIQLSDVENSDDEENWEDVDEEEEKKEKVKDKPKKR